MECHHFVDIFAMKGLEYLLAVLFLVTFVLFMRHLKRHAPAPRREPPPPPRLEETIVAPPKDSSGGR